MAKKVKLLRGIYGGLIRGYIIFWGQYIDSLFWDQLSQTTQNLNTIYCEDIVLIKEFFKGKTLKVLC